MCSIWTQDQWIDATNDNIRGYEDTYSLVETRYNEQGQRAILTQEKGYEQDFHAVYSEDGKDGEYTFTHYEHKGNLKEAKAAALAKLDARGFTLTEKPVIVQGKTLAQWSEEGKLNATREEHVHPQPPEGREPTEEEYEAYINSLTAGESFYVAMDLLTGALV